MDAWINAARRALSRAPTLAFPFSTLLEEMEREGVRTRGVEEWVLRKVEEEPGIFLVLSERIGPWAGPPGEPWILLQEALPTAFAPAERALRRIQAGLQAWGKVLDRRSQAAVARWMRGTREAEDILRAFARGA